MPFGYGMSVVLSGSMEPVLSVNDLVFIRETKNVQPGDIIVYESGGSLIIHRVLSTEGGVIITKGDANNVADEPFDLAAVKGKMIGHVPGVGALIRVLKTPAGTFALMAAAVLLIDLSCRPECGQDEDIEKEEN
jgi:signal peptidase